MVILSLLRENTMLHMVKNNDAMENINQGKDT